MLSQVIVLRVDLGGSEYFLVDEGALQQVTFLPPDVPEELAAQCLPEFLLNDFTRDLVLHHGDTLVQVAVLVGDKLAALAREASRPM